MKLKNATLLGMIGAIIGTLLSFIYFLMVTDIIGYEMISNVNWLVQLLSLCSNLTLAIFFYSLYKKQK